MTEISDYAHDFKVREFNRILDYRRDKGLPVTSKWISNSSAISNLNDFVNIAYPILERGSEYFNFNLSDFLDNTRKKEKLIPKQICRYKMREDNLKHLGRSNVRYLGYLFDMDHSTMARPEKDFSPKDLPAYKKFLGFLDGKTFLTYGHMEELFEFEAKFLKNELEKILGLKEGDLLSRKRLGNVPFARQIYFFQLVERNIELFGFERYDLISKITGFTQSYISTSEKNVRFYPDFSWNDEQMSQIKLIEQVKELVA